MIKNYFKIAVRHLLKDKFYSFINILGLAVGIACFVLIINYLRYELSYDTSLNHSEQLYRIALTGESNQTRTPHPLAQAMVKDFPEVASAVSLSPIWGAGLTRPKIVVRYEEKRFEEANILSADSTFFQVFDFPFLYGSAKNALQSPMSVVITESMARRYFGTQNPIGKTLLCGTEEIPLPVTAVLKDLPTNLHFHFDALIPYSLLKMRETGEYYKWSDFGHYNYVRLKNGADSKALEAKIPQWILKYIGNNLTEEETASIKSGNLRLDLQPVAEIHLQSHLRWELEANSSMSYVYIFAAVAIFILLIACINFINLSTARSAKRVKEIGMRKVLGADRKRLIGQFLGESLLTSLLASALAMLLMDFIEIFLTNVISNFSMITRPQFIDNLLIIFGTGILAGLIAGIYPAFYLSGIEANTIFKHFGIAGRASGKFRRALVVVQFAIAISLLISTGIAIAQLDFLQNKNLGFSAEHTLVIPLKSDEIQRDYKALKAEILRNPAIISASATSNVMGGRFNQHSVRWAGDKKQIDISAVRVDEDFFKAMEIKTLDGRTFSADFSADSGTVLINEEAAKQLALKNPVNEDLIWYEDEKINRCKVIGVVKNFHYQSLHQRIEPLIFQFLPTYFNYVLVKVKTENMAQTLDFLKIHWKKLDGKHDFEYSFLDEDLKKLYQSEAKLRLLFMIFSGLTLFVACLGLFALAAFTAEQRTKEIGIRKILGANVLQITTLLSKDFLKLVAISFFIAIPLAWYVTNKWLADFAYQTEISWSIFAGAGLLAVLVATLTVSWQSIKAALMNPVKSLRSE